MKLKVLLLLFFNCICSFQLPMSTIPVTNWILQGPEKGAIRAVILCHTRELSAQTYRECKKLAKGKNFCIKLMTKHLARNADFSKFPCDILISTPLRLRLAIQRKKVDLSRCVMMNISFLLTQIWNLWNFNDDMHFWLIENSLNSCRGGINWRIDKKIFDNDV